MKLLVGDTVKRNPEYKGSDHCIIDREPNYYTMEGVVISLDSLKVPMVKWNKFDSFTYPNFKDSLLKLKSVRDESLPDELFEL